MSSETQQQKMDSRLRSHNSHNKEDFRLDVQILRAVAILAVVSNHLELRFLSLPAGYRGVDIFFVISGYVIMSSLLKRERDGNPFQVSKFLVRRVRRLYPALIAVLIVVVVVSALTQSYIHVQQETSKSGLAATFFSSNYWFAREHVSYFSPLYPNPFLHTWSLAVEEQFYICFSLFLFVLHRLRVRFSSRLMSFLVLGFAGISLFSAIYSYRIFDFDRAPFHFGNDQLPFYSFHTRAWELLLGVLVAQVVARRNAVTEAVIQRTPKLMASFCIVLIAIALSFGGSDHRAGIEFFTVVVVVGTAGLIAGAPNTFYHFKLTRFRTSLLLIGEYSYVIYLVHWPIILMGDQIFGSSLLVKIGELMFTILGSIAVSNYVEHLFSVDKIRKDSVILRRFAIGQVALSVAMFALLLVAIVLEHRTDAIVAWEHIDKRCDGNTATCNIPITSANYSVLLEGDSHAGAFVNSFVKVVSDHQWSVKTLPPQKLSQLINADFSFLANDSSWIVVSYFHFTDVTENGMNAYGDHLADLIDNFNVVGIVVFLDNPEMENWRSPSLLRSSPGQSLSRSQQLRSTNLERGLRRMIAGGFPIQIIDPFVTLCPEYWCPTQVDGKDWYFDADHLAITGAQQLESQLAIALNKIR